MSSEKRNKLSEIFKFAWQFVKRNGYKLSEALKCAWLNIKLKAEMKKRIVKFYFQKIDGSLREAYGTTNPSIYEYVTFGEYDAKTIRKAVLETGYYGGIYKWFIIRVRNKKPPGVINQYAPGEFYAVTESDIWLMRYHKNILFAVNCKTTRKNKFKIKVFIFGN